MNTTIIIQGDLAYYELDPNGRISVYHLVQCEECLTEADAFIRMDYVLNGYLTNDNCPMCQGRLKVITYA